MSSQTYQDIKLKVLKTHSTLEGNGEIMGVGVEEDFNQESDHLILRSKYSIRNPWGLFLRVLMILFLALSVMSILFVVGKEWYILSHPISLSTNILDPESPENKCSIDRSWRFDCHPEPDATEAKCRERNCCWFLGDPNSREPFCYFSRIQTSYGYYNWTPAINTRFGLQAEANLISSSSFPKDVKKLMINVYYETQDTVRIKIYDPSVQRFEVPLDYKTSPGNQSQNVGYSVKLFPNGVQVYRNGRNFPLFDTTIAPMIYADQFLQVSSSLPSQYVYGIGEADDTLKRNLNWTKTVLWTHDRIPEANSNLYGAHPFYMVMEQSGISHGVFLANSNAMEVILQPAPAITFRTIGGILDFRVFVGPKPSDVVKQYTDVIGKPMLPPYFALGFHLCRYNYGTLNNTDEILELNLQAGIPIDVQWNDLDYMKNQNDFTFDPDKFKGLPEFVKKLHNRGMNYIPLIDAGISGDESASYAPYDEGLLQNIFITDGRTRKPFVGKVWNPNATVWPDFSHPNVSHYWMTQFQKFFNLIPIDGAWIDMNEPANFWHGTEDGKCDPTSSLDYPPYVPSVDGGKLHYKTICPSAKQYAGSHYNMHNLFGTLETRVTYNALGDVRAKRPFVISRSTFPGQGKYGGHWTGDVVSSFEHMRKSVPQMINFGLYGIPMVGADICGFHGNTTVELCRRWQQLGAFYPFSRNHNIHDGIPQDPASLGKIVIDAAKETLKVRYSILPYIYSLFFHAHVTGEPVARALFYEFPHDPNTYLIETQFMLGPSVMIIPILEENYTKKIIKAYLPSGYWYQHYYPNIIESFGEVRDIPVPEEYHSIPILYRAGTIVVKQISSQNTKESRNNPFTIHAFLTNGSAMGELYWDDGETPVPDVLTNYNHYNLKVERNTLSITPDKSGYIGINLTVDFIEIRGIMEMISVSSVAINNVYLENEKFSFNLENRTLSVNTAIQKLSITDGITMLWTP